MKHSAFHWINDVVNRLWEKIMNSNPSGINPQVFSNYPRVWSNIRRYYNEPHQDRPNSRSNQRPAYPFNLPPHLLLALVRWNDEYSQNFWLNMSPRLLVSKRCKHFIKWTLFFLDFCRLDILSFFTTASVKFCFNLIINTG